MEESKCKKCEERELGDSIEKKSMPIHRCWFCNGELGWCSDFNYDEIHAEGEGIVAILNCRNCGADAQFSIRTDEEEE